MACATFSGEGIGGRDVADVFSSYQVSKDASHILLVHTHAKIRVKVGQRHENGLHYTCHWVLKAEPSFDTWMRIKPMVKSRRKVTMLNEFFVKNIERGYKSS